LDIDFFFPLKHVKPSPSSKARHSLSILSNKNNHRDNTNNYLLREQHRDTVEPNNAKLLLDERGGEGAGWSSRCTILAQPISSSSIQVFLLLAFVQPPALVLIGALGLAARAKGLDHLLGAMTTLAKPYATYRITIGYHDRKFNNMVKAKHNVTVMLVNNGQAGQTKILSKG
jgi:hypothetical protein